MTGDDRTGTASRAGDDLHDDGVRPVAQAPVAAQLPDAARAALERLVDTLSTQGEDPDTRPGATEEALQAALEALVQGLAASDGAAGPLVALGKQAVSLRRERDNLHVALATNRVIGAAVGVVMTQHRVTYDVALDRLVRESQNANRKLRELAEEVLETGTLPGEGDPS